MRKGTCTKGRSVNELERLKSESSEARTHRAGGLIEVTCMNLCKGLINSDCRGLTIPKAHRELGSLAATPREKPQA